MTTQDYRTRSPLRIFLSYFKPHWKLFSLDMGCAILIALVDLAFPLVSRTALYQWLPEKNYRVFFVVMAVVALAFVLRAVLYYIVTYWGHTFGIRVEADIRRDLFHHMQMLGFDFYDRNRTGQLMSRLTTDLFELTELAHHGPEDLTISVITIVGALAVMFTIEWRMALIVMAIIPVFLAVLMLLRGGMSRASVAAKQKTGAINAEIESGLSGIRTVKAFGNETIQQQRFDCANETFKTAKRGFHKEMGRFNATMELFVTLLNVAVIAGGGWLIMGERMDYVDLITFSLYITTFITPVRKLANFAELFSNGFAGLHRFIELMSTEPTIADAPDAVTMEHVRGAVEVKDVSFTYDGAEEVLHHVNLHVAVGETVAVVGPSGGGKSTLAKHMNAVLLPTGGKVWVEGMDTADQALLLEVRRRMGMVFQNPDNQIVANVVEEDVAFAPENLGVSTEEIRRRVDDALEAVGMTDYARHAPHLLSGGQKQRIAIAGVIAMAPECIVLDESTAMLDPVGRREVLTTVHRLNRERGITVVLITHHMNEAMEADRAIVMNRGSIAMDGPPREVFSRVEKLRELGLAAPDTVELLYELRSRGIDIPLDAMTVEECADAICHAFSGGIKGE